MLRTMASTVLLVEDDNGIAAPLVRILRREGYEVIRADTGGVAVERVADGGIDLIFLDLGLPDMDGLEVCRRLRKDGFSGGIMILTARGDELDRVEGLDVGADDYLAKPFALAELLARTRAVLRRTTPVAEAPRTAAGGLRINAGARRAWVDDTEISFTAKEFDVLAMLLDGAGTVVRREALMRHVWDDHWFGSTKVLDVTVGRLRQKLDHSGSATGIVTVRGVGFRIEVGRADA